MGPASPQQAHNVETTSIQRQDVISTLNRRCVNVVCSLGPYVFEHINSFPYFKNFNTSSVYLLKCLQHCWMSGKQCRYLPPSILYKSIAGRCRPVSCSDGPITAHYRFIKNPYWVSNLSYSNIFGTMKISSRYG